MMGFLDFHFGRKYFEFTPLPDDYPPDGSMQFMPYEPKPYLRIPTNFLHYEFGPNCGESNPVAVNLSIKVIKELCQEKLILAVIRSNEPRHHRKHKAPPPTFAELYYQVLQKARPDVSTYLKTNLCLAYLTVGYDAIMLAAYQTFPINTECFFDFYVFSLDQAIPDARTAFDLTKSFQYDMKLEYIDHGPVSLEMDVNKNTADLASIQAVVERICRENSVLLRNPPASSL